LKSTAVFSDKTDRRAYISRVLIAVQILWRTMLLVDWSLVGWLVTRTYCGETAGRIELLLDTRTALSLYRILL